MKRFTIFAMLVLLCVLPALAAQLVSDPDHSCQISVKGNWQINQQPGQHAVVLTSLDHPGMQINLRYLPGASVDEAWMEKFKATLVKQMAGAKWGPQSRLTLAGVPATRLDLESGGCPMSFIVIEGEKKAWLVMLVATGKLDYEKVFMPVLQSMKI